MQIPIRTGRRAVPTLSMFLVAIACAMMAPPSFAETEEPTEVYTDTGQPEADVRAPSGFHGMLGAAVFAGQRSVGSDGTRVLPLPLLFLAYKDVAYWSIGGGGVWLLRTDDRSLRFGAGVSLHGGWKPDDEAELAGMEKRKGSLDGYLNAVWRTPLVSLGARYYHDIARSEGGDAASLRLSRNFRVSERVRLTPSVGAVWQSRERVSYYYGVKPLEALPFRPAYRGRSATDLSAGLAASVHLSRSWFLLAGVFATRLGRGITDSPIVTRRWTTTGFAGAGWMF